MSKDRYKAQGGGKFKVASFHDAMTLVYDKYPRAWLEGSTGPERTIWIDLYDGVWGVQKSEKVVVGHMWETPKTRQVYVRIFEKLMYP